MDKPYVFNSDGGANGFANSVLPLLQQRGIDPAILLNGNRGGGRSGNRGGYGERDDYMRYDGVDYGERRGRRNR